MIVLTSLAPNSKWACVCFRASCSSCMYVHELHVCKVYIQYCAGEPQTFTLSVRPARNYPLDLYFLMDLSGSQALDLVMLRNLSNSISESLLLTARHVFVYFSRKRNLKHVQFLKLCSVDVIHTHPFPIPGNDDFTQNLLVEELERISSQFTLGFGSYVDKIARPYASTLQNGLDYLEFHLTRQRCVLGASIHVYTFIIMRLPGLRLECATGRDSCEPTYVYRHHLSLTSNDNSQFRVRVNLGTCWCGNAICLKRC